MLAKHPGLHVVGEASTVTDAANLVAAHEPDVLFLDIQLGHQSGFELIEQHEISADIIFVTAFDRHAVRAFEVNAVDYLLKPVHPDRLARAIRRLDRQPVAQVGDARLSDEDRLFLKAGGRWRFIRLPEILAIEAAGDYTRIQTAQGPPALMHTSLREWEAKLPANRFLRIHRSTIVNLDAVTRIEEWSRDTFRVHLAGRPQPYPMSRRYAARLKS